MRTNFGIVAIAIAGLAVSAQADVISQWNFNSNPADANTGTGLATPSTGSGTLSGQGGITLPSFNAGGTTGVGPASSSDPAFASGDNSGQQTTTYPAQGVGSGTAGLRFDVSTVGVTDIIISWDQRFSNTSSRFYRLEYALDGSILAPVWVTGADFENTIGGDSWINGNTVNLSSVDAAENNANFAFRIVAVFGPGGAYVASRSTPATNYAPAGTWRFDMVTLSATVPTPGATALLGMGLIAASRRRR